MIAANGSRQDDGRNQQPLPLLPSPTMCTCMSMTHASRAVEGAVVWSGASDDMVDRCATSIIAGAVQVQRAKFPVYSSTPSWLNRPMEKTLPPLTPGTLYLVATPIGNVEDMTLRALRTLKECDVIAAEDTRRTGQLLRHFGISKPLLSYFHFNEARRSEEIIERLRRGEKVALVTDAGSPGISDPGERVVRASLIAGFRVEAVPGPCALVAALTASGLPTGEFHFVGFLPHKSGQRRNKLAELKSVSGTLVLYESPYRIEKLLAELNDIFPDGFVVLARELTKKFEEFLRGKPGDLL